MPPEKLYNYIPYNAGECSFANIIRKHQSILFDIEKSMKRYQVIKIQIYGRVRSLSRGGTALPCHPLASWPTWVGVKPPYLVICKQLNFSKFLAKMGRLWPKHIASTRGGQDPWSFNVWLNSPPKMCIRVLFGPFSHLLE